MKERIKQFFREYPLHAALAVSAIGLALFWILTRIFRPREEFAGIPEPARLPGVGIGLPTPPPPPPLVDDRRIDALEEGIMELTRRAREPAVREIYHPLGGIDVAIAGMRQELGQLLRREAVPAPVRQEVADPVPIVPVVPVLPTPPEWLFGPAPVVPPQVQLPAPVVPPQVQLPAPVVPPQVQLPAPVVPPRVQLPAPVVPPLPRVRLPWIRPVVPIPEGPRIPLADIPRLPTRIIRPPEPVYRRRRTLAPELRDLIPRAIPDEVVE